MSNPLDSYFEKKAAFSKKVTDRFADFAPTVAAASLAGAAIFGGESAAKGIYHAVTKRSNYKKMLERNPDLQQHLDDNPDQFISHYNSLHSVNPLFASDPVIAGTYMRQMSLAPRTAGNVIVESLAAVPRKEQRMNAPLGVYRESNFGGNFGGGGYGP